LTSIRQVLIGYVQKKLKGYIKIGLLYLKHNFISFQDTETILSTATYCTTD